MSGDSRELSRSDGGHNRTVIQDALDRDRVCLLPPGRIPLRGGLLLGEGHQLAGAAGTAGAGTVLESETGGAQPVVHVLGGHSAVRDLTIALPCSTPGPHDGARFTALTIGDYLYPTRPAWIEQVTADRVRVVRPARCAANSIAVMGAVRGVGLRDIDVTGGGTGIAVHWGAVAASVSEITGPSYHPCRLAVSGLRVRDAYEGFYLSSVHDVEVGDVDCADVEIGFRLLPGDNADAYHEEPADSQVSQRITVSGARIGWRGIYAIRVAGWGRSEVDRAVRRLTWRDVTIDGCTLTAGAAVPAAVGRTRRAVVLEHGGGVTFDGLAIGGGGVATAEASIDGRPATLAELPTAPARRR